MKRTLDLNGCELHEGCITFRFRTILKKNKHRKIGENGLFDHFEAMKEISNSIFSLKEKCRVKVDQSFII